MDAKEFKEKYKGKFITISTQKRGVIEEKSIRFFREEDIIDMIDINSKASHFRRVKLCDDSVITLFIVDNKESNEKFTTQKLELGLRVNPRRLNSILRYTPKIHDKFMKKWLEIGRNCSNNEVFKLLVINHKKYPKVYLEIFEHAIGHAFDEDIVDYIDKKFEKYDDLMIHALRSSPEIFETIPKEFYFKALSESSYFMRELFDRIEETKQSKFFYIVLEYLETHLESLKNIRDEYYEVKKSLIDMLASRDEKVCVKLLEMKLGLKTMDEYNLYRKILISDPLKIQYISYHNYSYKELCMFAIKENSESFKYVSDKFSGYKQLCTFVDYHYPSFE